MFMVDDVVLNKAASIERCVARAREEYARDPSSFEEDYTRHLDDFLTYSRLLLQQGVQNNNKKD